MSEPTGSLETCEVCGAEATHAHRVMTRGEPVRDEHGRIWPTWAPGPWRYGCRWHPADLLQPDTGDLYAGNEPAGKLSEGAR